MTKTIKDISLITLISLILTLLIWLPFLLGFHSFWGLDFSAGFNSIYRNYDGLEYIAIAKTLYNPQALSALPFTLPPIYYASHFPGYSLLILLFAPFLGFLKSMLFVSLASTIGAAIAFYFLVKDFKLTTQPLFLSLLFLILPARWLIVHSVGSAEPTFILFTILAIYFFLKFESHKSVILNPIEDLDSRFSRNDKWLWLSALAGLAAQLTRPPGILLFIALTIYIILKPGISVMLLTSVRERSDSISFSRFYRLCLQNDKLRFIKYSPLLLIPLSLLLVFFWFGQSYSNFFAYFHSGDNIHLTFPPFQVFNKHQFWVGEIWLEDIVYIFILGFLAGMFLLKEKLYPMAFFVFTYLAATTLVVHRDISRYVLPIFPFVLIAFQKLLVSKEFKIVLIIVALAIYLYAENFMIENTAPIPNLEYFN